MATASKRPRTGSDGAPAESAPRPPSAVYVLVRTADCEGRGCDWECNADSQVVGVYTSSELAERAKRNATKGYETTDEINYHQGECWYTSFTIHRKTVEDEVESDEDY